MKILYIPSLNIPVVYWRIETYAQQLVANSSKDIVHVDYIIDLEESPNLDLSWEAVSFGYGEPSEQIQKKLKSAFEFFDVIIFQKLQFKKSVVLVSELQKLYPHVKVLAEIDDHIGDVSPSTPHTWTDQHSWAAEQVYRADGIICSTKYLGESMRHIVGKDKPIHVAPNCIHEDSWKIEENGITYDEKRIGYVSGGSHDEDLLIAYRAIKPLLDKDKNLKFVIRFGGFRPDFLEEHTQIDFQPCNWHIGVYPQMIYDLKLDLALAPLRDTDFNRSKSNIKWLEMAYMGIPVVGSNVEPYKNTKGDILLSSNDIKDFRDKICLGLKQIPDRQKLRYQCLKYYNIKKESDNLLTYLKKIVLMKKGTLTPKRRVHALA